jgi:hypothetical protein
MTRFPSGMACAPAFPGAAPRANRPPAGAVEGPFSARFPSSPFRGDIPAGAVERGWR